MVRYVVLMVATLASIACSQEPSSQPQHPLHENWVRAFSSPDGDGYFDENSIRSEGAYRLVNMKMVVPPDSPENKKYAAEGKPIVVGSTGVTQLDCAARTTELTNVRVQFANGREFMWPKQEPEQIQKGSHTSRLYDLACQR